MKFAADPNLRNWLLTNPATTTVALDANGVANLTALIATPRILLECLKYGEITRRWERGIRRSLSG